MHSNLRLALVGVLLLAVLGCKGASNTADSTKPVPAASKQDATSDASQEDAVESDGEPIESGPVSPPARQDYAPKNQDRI